MFLFILESIGTPELILIAIVALIVFGPRKLPQIIKTAGKTMAEFRNATNEFKSTWEKEVAFEDDDESQKKVISPWEDSAPVENTIGQRSQRNLTEDQFPAPQVKELSPENFSDNFKNKSTEVEELQPVKDKVEKSTTDKRDWI